MAPNKPGLFKNVGSVGPKTTPVQATPVAPAPVEEEPIALTAEEEGVVENEEVLQMHEEEDLEEDAEEDAPVNDVPAPAPAPVRVTPAPAVQAVKTAPVVVNHSTGIPVTVATEKMVKVRPLKDHHCHIGGTDYYLKKGVIEAVPENVKQILVKKGGILTAL